MAFVFGATDFRPGVLVPRSIYMYVEGSLASPVSSKFPAMPPGAQIARLIDSAPHPVPET